MTAIQRAASREAFAAAESRLVQLTTDADSTALGTLADELFAVVGLLSKESALRRAVADPATAPAARTELISRLLSAKVSSATLTVLSTVVSARWSSPRELIDGVETLARTALLISAERQGRLDAIEDELFRLGRIVAGQSELERLLSDPAGSPENKQTLVHGLINGKVESITATLVQQLVAYPRGRNIVAGLEELAAAAARRRERSVAHVRSAVALDQTQQERLTAILTRIYARPIALHLEVEPGLAGGLVIKVDDEIIDGSAAGRLEALRRVLAS